MASTATLPHLQAYLTTVQQLKYDDVHLVSDIEGFSSNGTSLL